MQQIFPPRVPRPVRRGDPEFKSLARTAWQRGRTALLAGAFGVLLAAPGAQAQSVSTYTFAVTTTTYTDISGTGTAITTLPDNNNGTSAEQNIGFALTYGGNSYTRFMLNSNGFVKLGTAGMTGPSSNALFAASRVNTTNNAFSSTNAADQAIISATNTDWTGGTFHVLTTGAAGSRVTTIQFRNLSDNWGTQQYLAANFQIILTEGTNTVVIKHGTWTQSAVNTTASFLASAAGLKGATGNVRSISKGSGTASTSATAGTSAVSTWSFTRSTVPVFATTYTFTPPAGAPFAIGTITSAQPFTTNVEKNSIDNPVLRLTVPTTGNAGNLTLNSVTVTTPNTSATVSGVKLWYSTSITFSTATATQLGTTQSVSGSVATFSGLTQTFTLATAYLHVTFDIAGTATIGQTVDASITDGDIIITADGGATAPGLQPATAQNPAGTRTVDYCTSSASSSTSVDIGRVRVAGIDNAPANNITPVSNTNATGQYSNFTSLTGTIRQGEPYLLTVNTITSLATVSTTYVTAYIDLNQNGSFSDAGEALFSEIVSTTPPVTVASRQAQGVIQIPGTATLGTTRMRIVASTTSGLGPCSTYTTGETEDYTLTVLTPPTCTSVTGVSISNVTNNAAQVNFSLGSGGGTAEIEYGPAGFTPGTGTIVGGLTGSPYTIPGGLTASTPYDVYVRRDCGGSNSSTLGPLVFTTIKAPMAYAITRTQGITYNTIRGASTALPFSGANLDDQLTDALLFSNAAIFPSGFNFDYPTAGTAVTGLKISTNGWLTFNTAETLTRLGNDLDIGTNMVAPLWEDLTGPSLDSMRYALTGAAGSQTLTIEWLSWRRLSVAGSNLNFQVKLYEGTDRIEFVYGVMSQFDGNGNGTTAYSYSLGLNGNPATDIASQQVENTANFANLANNNLKRVPACSSRIAFVPGTYVPTFAPVAGAPTNDNCSGAIQLNVAADPVTAFCTLYSSANATASPSIPVCTGPAVLGTPDDDVWFAFTVPAGPAINVTVAVAGAQGYNPILQMFSGSCGALTAVNCQNATTTTGSAEAIQATGLIGGQTYLVRVYESGPGFGTASTTFGGFALEVYESPVQPANDICTSAVTLTPNAACSNIVNGTTRGAVITTTNTVCAGTTEDDVWYQFVATTAGAEISVVGAGTFNAVLEISSGTCAALIPIGCANATTTGIEALQRTDLVVGTTYYVRVFSVGTLLRDRGNFSICVRSFSVVANDECAGAITLPVSTSCVTTNGTTVNATGSNPTLAFCGLTAVDDDVWYSFVAPASGAVRITTTTTTFNQATQLFSGPCASLVSVLCASATTGAGTETLTRTGLAAGTYYVRVHGAATGEPSGTFTICVQELTAPANNEPAGAITLAVGPTGCATPTPGTTLLATATPSIPLCAAVGTPDDDVWYKFTPTISAPTITVSGASNLDAAVQLLREDPMNPGTYLSIQCEETTNSGQVEQLDASGLTPGQLYYVRVFSFGATATTQGDFTICVSQQPKVVAAVTITQASTAVVPINMPNNNAILRVQVRITGGVGTKLLQSVTFRGANTSNTDLALNGVKLWVTNQTGFDASTATLLGSTNFNGSNDAVFTGLSYDFPSGSSYLFLTYTIRPTAVIGNSLDAQLLANQLVIDGAPFPATLANPFGVRLIAPPAPANDNPCGAFVLTVQTGRPIFTAGSTSGATDTAPSVSGSCQGLVDGFKDVYYRVTVPATGELNVELRRPTGSTFGDARLYLYSFATCSGQLTVLNCDNNDGLGDLPSLHFTGLTPNATLLVRVGMASGAVAGNFEIAVTDRIIFTGATSSSFTTIGNFFPIIEPATVNVDNPSLTTVLASATVVVPANAVTMPTIGANTTLGGLTIKTGATLSLTAGTLTVNGALVLNGGLPTNAASTLALGVTGALPSTFSASYAYPVQNLTVGNSGLTILNTSLNSVQVRRLLTLDGLLTTNGRLTLLSDAAGTAMVVNNVGGAAVGPVTVQRYLDPSANPRLGYRHFAAPVTNTTVNDLGVFSGAGQFFPIANPAYNAAADPTDGSVSPYPNVFDYDDSRVNPAFPIFERGYRSPTALTSPLESGRGYTAYFSGLAKPDFVGTLGNGDVPVPVQNTNGLGVSGWNLLGNPYPAPMNWDQVPAATLTAAGLNTQVSVYRSDQPFTVPGAIDGVYLTRANNAGSLPNGLIAMGQGFFVRRPATGSATLTITNAMRQTTYANPSHFRTTTETRPMVDLALRQVGRPTGDATTVYFENGATPQADLTFDGYKLRSTGSMPSIFTLTSVGDELSVNGLPTLDPAATTVVPLGVVVTVTGAYKLDLTRIVNIPAGMQVLLRDAVTGTDQDLLLNSAYTFTMDANFRGSRFALVFGPANGPTGTAAALSGTVVQVYPNPVTPGAELRIALTGLPTTVGSVGATLLDNVGRVVGRTTLAVRGGATEGAVLTTGLSRGVYSLRLQTGAATVVRRVVVE